MIDPGALGTLHIGLESVRLDDEISTARRQRRMTQQRASRRVTPAVAGWLRGLANRLDRPIPRAARS